MLGSHGVKGDTLIEVLFAVTVFSMVAVGALSIMNQGSAASQRALEITLVRQQIDSQAETLRFLNNSYVTAYSGTGQTYSPGTPAKQWTDMLASIELTGTAKSSDLSTCSAPVGSFIFDPQTAQFIAPNPSKIVPAMTFSQLVYNAGNFSLAQGIWIEAIRSADNKTDDYQAHIGYIDFHIRACWPSPGQAVPVTLGTIVRLYEPR